MPLKARIASKCFIIPCSPLYLSTLLIDTWSSTPRLETVRA
jgi:hypothetical protein